MPISITPIGAALGAEVTGVDLDEPLDNETAAAVLDAFHHHLVLVFRDQSLSPESQIRFTRLFGPAEPHPLKTRRTVEGHPEVLVLENRPGQPGARNDYWHSDISHAERPPLASILHAKTIPTGRGDTMYCNMYQAWEDLSAGMRAFLEDLRAAHSAEATLRRNNLEHNDGLRIEDLPEPSLHPVARRVPDTDRLALYVNPHFTARFEDMTVEESRPVLDYLVAQATRPENVYRHRWVPGDVVAWDNRCTMHYAVRDYDESMPRYLHRTTAGGERPQ